MINNDKNINRLNKQQPIFTEVNGDSGEIKSLMNNYQKFKLQMNKSEFANSFPRYCAELEYLTKIRDLNVEQDNQDDFIVEEEKRIRDILENDFGFIPND